MASPTSALFVSVRRPDDLMVLTFAGVNLQVEPDGAGGRRVTRADPAAPGYLVVDLGPQHVEERAYFETDPHNAAGQVGETPDPPPVPSRAADPSRLVFRWPDALTDLPYTLADLLAWERLEPVLVDVAGGVGLIRRPRDINDATGPPETAVELPYRLVLSPGPEGGWTHSVVPDVLADRVELWHTRLGTRSPDGVDADAPVAVRAVWSPDWRPPGELPPGPNDTDIGVGRAALSPNDRHQIVRLTSDTTMVLSAGSFDFPLRPMPLAVERLSMSALGGTLRSSGEWEQLQSVRGISLSEWRHIATLGRDQFVRVVHEGVLFPTGHSAALITITERMFQHAGGPVTGYLRQRMFVVRREPLRTYAVADQVNDGRELPLRSIRLTALLTPSIDDPTQAPSFITSEAFWVNVGGTPFLFHAVADDVEGNSVEPSIPSIFVRQGALGLDMVRTAYESDDARRRVPVPHQRLAYAKRAAGGEGDTTLPTDALYLTAAARKGATTLDWDTFSPTLHKADVHIEAVEHATGRPGTTRIRPYQGYLDSGFDAANAALVYATIDQEHPLGASFSADQAGGLATPNTAFAALSQHLGPVPGPTTGAPADLAQVAGGHFDPAVVFGAVSAKLLGTIRLQDLVQAFTAGVPAPPEHYPKLRTTATAGGTRTTLDWTPGITKVTLAGVATFRPNQPKMSIAAVFERRLDGTEVKSTVSGRIDDFQLELLGVLVLRIASFSFTSESGAKPAVKVDLPTGDTPPAIKFEGPLSFVEELRSLIPPGVFGDGPHIDLTPTGVDIGYTLALPPAAVGIFALKDLALSTALHVPFLDGRLTFRFAVSSREHPFLVAVSLFGGGGFFAIQLGLDGIDLVEASFEFGGLFALDIGVASGSVSLMAGIYLRGDRKSTVLEGFVRVDGSVSVLGLITITATFVLSLSYDPGSGKARGQATLTVGIHIVFFSTSVSLTVERSYGGSGGDPKFGQMISEADWAAYDAAFA